MKLGLFLAAATLLAQSDGVELFEKEIRPVLAGKCYTCHSANAKAPMGGLTLDTRAGLQKGGANGPVIVPGSPAASRLMKALSYTDPHLRMPPAGKLSDREIAAFERWIASGAVDPREESAPAATARKGIDVEAGRGWWAFQPLQSASPPEVRNAAWTRKPLDSFVLAELQKHRLRPSPAADARTLIIRASLDLTGLRPTYDEVQAFVQDQSPDAYRKLIDRLLESPHYGERWGRYWLDVARFAEDNPTSEATNPPYPFAWRYRDWVVEAMNQDMPYDRLVKMQLAADLMPGTSRSDLRALGYLGAAPTYHKDARLSREVIETIYSDDWDERVDAVTRGILGLTVACARCHDHKFDPILTKDYYGLASVFASTVAVPRPLAEVAPETESKFLWAVQQVFFLNYVANLMKNEPGSKPEEAAKKSVRYAAEVERIKDDMAFLQTDHAQLHDYIMRIGQRPPQRPPQTAAGNAAGNAAPPPPPPQRRRGGGASTEPFVNAVYDAGLWVDGSDPDLTMLEIKPGTPHDLPVFRSGNVANPGESAPRQFVTVLSKGDPRMHVGSGRLELAERIFSDAAPLAARVIVNRVWSWHFGRPLVATTSDFGVQGEKPSHPQLLEDLAARFVTNGWSLKWLHREIMLSAAYCQESKPRDDARAADESNRLLWRMNPRRLDIESYRDNLLKVSGTLDLTLYGPSIDLDAADNHRRTVYGRVSRGRLNTVLRLYDFPDASQHSPSRELTTTPLQQLFVMNSPFLRDRSTDLVKSVESAQSNAEKIRSMYRRVLARDPTGREVDLAETFLSSATLLEYAQALLSTNEVIFWP